MRARSLLVVPLLLATSASCKDKGADVPPQPTASASAVSTAPERPAYPAAEKRPVASELHGTKVSDDYQWLEASDEPAVKAWVDAENAFTKASLGAVPARAALRARIHDILTASSGDWFALRAAKGRLFALKFQPPKQQPLVVVMTSANEPASERVVVDPTAIDPSGHTSIDYYVPSPDGKMVAVSLSEGGTENGTVHVFDVESGKDLGDAVPWANSGTAGGSLAWAGDSKGFYYTRHPHPGEVKPEDMGFFQQVYFHALGTKDAADAHSFGKDLPRIAEIALATRADGKVVLASVQNGDGGEYWHFVLDPKSGKWQRFADIPDKVVHAEFGDDGKLYLLSHAGAPRGKVLRVDGQKPELAKAETLVPESEATVQSFVATQSKLYVRDLLGGPSQVRVFDLAGKAAGTVPIPPVSGVRQLVPVGGDDLIFRGVSFTAAPAWYAYSAKDGKVERTALAVDPGVKLDDAEAVRETCRSKDGTEIPITIVRKKGTALDGTNPTLLYGYGGYGVSIAPRFDPLLRVWLDMGGVFAVANLRGGGEFGEAWHLAGNLEKKQTVFDDFYGCAQHLVATKVTTPEHLAIIGGSNGGLLMGAALTQHPEAYRAVVSYVGIYDMLRVELTPNGQFNVTEFGTVKNPDHFRAMYAYSPYHNVKDGTGYPPVLFLSGSNDPRVDPWQSRKMTARLQAASTGGEVLLRESSDTGHGGGTPLDAQIDEEADVYAFLVRELRLAYPPSAP